MLAGEGRLTCVIHSRRRMSRTLTAMASPCRAWRKIDSFPIITLVHDNLFSYGLTHTHPLPTDLFLITPTAFCSA